MIVSVLSLMLAIGSSYVAFAEENPAPAPAPNACSELIKKYEELGGQSDIVCQKMDKASQKQCEAFDKQLIELEKELDKNKCEGGEGESDEENNVNEE